MPTSSSSVATTRARLMGRGRLRLVDRGRGKLGLEHDLGTEVGGLRRSVWAYENNPYLYVKECAGRFDYAIARVI